VRLNTLFSEANHHSCSIGYTVVTDVLLWFSYCAAER
jgi:hypothetical protein